jgi:hypothetical protein
MSTSSTIPTLYEVRAGWPDQAEYPSGVLGIGSEQNSGKYSTPGLSPLPTLSSVSIHEHCNAAEILVFGRETIFPTQTVRRWYIYKSPQEMETHLIKVFQSFS